MRKIITATFITMDGVMQAPGGPEEDKTDDFAYGGWQMNYGEDVIKESLNKIFELPFELLLGRRTYGIFASYWPHDTEEPEVAKPFNSTKKYVVSHNSIELPGEDIMNNPLKEYFSVNPHKLITKLHTAMP